MLRLECLEDRTVPSFALLTLASFQGAIGAEPDAGPIMDSVGNLYGTTRLGGASNLGAVFELVQGSNMITTLASFNGADGAEPNGSLVMDKSGNLYGTTRVGGANNDGTVFELAQGSSTITTLTSFNTANGLNPEAGLIMDSSGNLFGTTFGGGADKLGTVFELPQGSGTITTLASFDNTHGAGPGAGLILDASGNLFGTTTAGGVNGAGAVFELAQGSGTISTLASFNISNGDFPESRLIRDASGNLYGTTKLGGASGAGTVFELPNGSGAISTLASFNGANGANPVADLIMDTSGDLYGTTELGGANNGGTVFEAGPGGSTITTLASLGGGYGSGSLGGLIRDPSGNLYGTTMAGGAANDGTIFELSVPLLSTLASFTLTNGAGPDGASPGADLIRDPSGNFYSTTVTGGAYGYGSVFQLAPGSGTIITLASFDNTNGASPVAGLILDPSGNLYGTTQLGGANGDGTVFELAHGSGTITTLASFNGANGFGPLADLIMDASGNLYGTTSYGGTAHEGTVFKLAKGSGTIITLASFDNTNGANPAAGLILDPSGNLYGTTFNGGASLDGTVFELAHGSSTITTLASFNGTNGNGPSGALSRDMSGNFYGTTRFGGANDDGTVFELAHGSHTITTLASFNFANGQEPDGGVISDGNGNLFGTTRFGGAYSSGTVFELAQGSRAFTNIELFNFGNGSNPRGALIMDSSGNLYGTTESGGGGSYGTVFALLAPSPFHLGIVAQRSVSAGVPFTLTVTALDSLGNALTNYRGTVSFGSSDSQPGVVLPASYQFTALDAGVHTFSGVTLDTAGSQTITATDVLDATMRGTGNTLVRPVAASHLGVFLAFATAGVNFTFTVEALDPFGNVDPTYRGTIQITTDDPTATVPANYTFTSGDNGIHAFTNGMRMTRAGQRLITAQDMAAPSIKGSVAFFLSAAPATHFSLTGPMTVTEGEPFTLTVTALDQFLNVVTQYRGTVHFTLQGGGGTVPGHYTFQTFIRPDRGSHTFTNGFTLTSTGPQTISVADTVSRISGSITVQVVPAIPTHFLITAPSSVTAGVAFSVTITVLSAANTVVADYTGTVHFSSTDPAPQLPANYTFTAGDAGTHTFSATLTKAGTQSITATDTVLASINGSDTGIVVSSGAATHFALMAPSTVTAGAPFSITVTALDAYGNVATGYQGKIKIACTNGRGNLPSTYTFTAANNGVHTFTKLVNRVKGRHIITMTDTLDGTILGSLTVNVV
jgi:uncharacterized repeat protein (TIGR03803 family)